MEVTQFADIYRGKKVLVTGHTGFKGSWLCLWLRHLGARMSGIALDPPTTPNHFDLCDIPMDDIRQDIRDEGRLKQYVEQVDPDIVFHLAAQSLVRPSYDCPVDTWGSNLMGSAHLLDACRGSANPRAVVMVTTDKVYRNLDDGKPFSETDELGGHDPYSASKAASEILIESYRKSFFSDSGGPLLAVARAGNVIGGGDWSAERIIPDVVRAISSNRCLSIRSPGAVRPWQHVFDCLLGYLLLGQGLLEGRSDLATAWNFGPSPDSRKTVDELLVAIRKLWPSLEWQADSPADRHESGLLQLDSSRASRLLDWQPVWSFDAALGNTVEWYREYLENDRVCSGEQILGYFAAARQSERSWIAA